MNNLFAEARLRHLLDVENTYKLMKIISANYTIKPTFIVDVYTPCLANILHETRRINNIKRNKTNQIIEDNGKESTESTFYGSKVLDTTLLFYSQLNPLIDNNLVKIYAGGQITHIPHIEGDSENESEDEPQEQNNQRKHPKAIKIRHIGLPLCAEVLLCKQIQHTFITNNMCNIDCTGGGGDSGNNPEEISSFAETSSVTCDIVSKVYNAKGARKALKAWMEEIDENCSFMTGVHYCKSVRYR